MMDEQPPEEANAEYIAIDNYSHFAYYYDLYYQEYDEDVDLYQKIAQQVGAEARVLEVACGSGRLFMPLLRDGYTMTGLDLSQEMLEICRQKIAAEPPEFQQKTRLVRGDMRDLDGLAAQEEFDLIILGYNSFQHLPTLQDKLTCLRSIHHRLAAEGCFVIAVVNPQIDPHAPTQKRTEYWGSVPNLPRNSAVKLLVNITEDPATQQIQRNYNFYEKLPNETIEHVFAPMTLYYLYRDQLQALLEQASFRIEHLYGSYQFDEFNAKSEKIIYLCRKH